MREIIVLDEHGERRTAFVPAERPLRIVVDGRVLVTLMTLGGQPELLVLGFLLNQRLIGAAAALASIDVDWDTGVATVATRAGLPSRSGETAHEGTAPDLTGCSIGTAFGDLIGRLGGPLPPPASPARVSHATLLHVLATMRERDAIHRAAGSVHGAALFDGDGLLVSIEDVSRHNGVDTVTGWMALHGITGAGMLLFSTGRLTAEMVAKAAHNGISVLVSRNGTTAMGAALASELGMMLVTRAAGRRFVISAGAERFAAEDPDG